MYRTPFLLAGKHCGVKNTRNSVDPENISVCQKYCLFLCIPTFPVFSSALEMWQKCVTIKYNFSGLLKLKMPLFRFRLPYPG